MIESQDLRGIQVFSDLPEEQLAWLAPLGEDISAEPGEVLFREGDPAEHMYVFFEGEFQGRSERVSDGRLFMARAGDVTGLLPFSRLQSFQGTGRAVTRVRVGRFHKRLFPEMLQRMPVLTERLVALMLDRVRDFTRMSEQRDKLAALGKLSAGFAHELNNPAAAIKRAAGAIWEVRKELRKAYLRLDQRSLTRDQRTYIADCEQVALVVIHDSSSKLLTSIERSDREQELEEWMQEHSISEPWKIAPMLVEAEFGPAKAQGDRGDRRPGGSPRRAAPNQWFAPGGTHGCGDRSERDADFRFGPGGEGIYLHGPGGRAGNRYSCRNRKYSNHPGVQASHQVDPSRTRNTIGPSRRSRRLRLSELEPGMDQLDRECH